MPGTATEAAQHHLLPPPLRPQLPATAHACAAVLNWHRRPSRHCRADRAARTALIHGGFLQEQPVADLAQKIGLSARQLQRLFVEHLGATPAQIHATHRLLLAKQLLTETTLPVTDAALAAGYNSLRRFNTAFLQGLRHGTDGAAPPAPAAGRR